MNHEGSGIRRVAALAGVVALAAALTLSACGGGAPAAAPAPAAPRTATASPAASSGGGSQAAAASSPAAASAGMTHVTICIPAQTNSTLPIFAAQDAGLLAQQHIDATLPNFSNRIDSAFMAGQCNMAFDAGAEDPVMQGFPARVVAVTSVKIPFQIWGQPSIASMAALKGKMLGTSGPGSLSYRVGNYLLQLNHLVPNKDVTEIPIAGAAPTLAALLSGRVSAAVISAPLTFQAQAKGMKLLFSAPPSEYMLMETLVTTQSYLDSHRAVVQGVIKAVDQAMTRLRTSESFYGREMQRFTHLQLKGAQLKQYWDEDRTEYNLPPIGTQAEAIRSLQLFATKPVDFQSVASKWLDMSIVKQLYAQGGSGSGSSAS
jgi:ABC-type nitrate/sulfonate/bicarbonate transport system substrate-binding protein